MSLSCLHSAANAAREIALGEGRGVTPKSETDTLSSIGPDCADDGFVRYQDLLFGNDASILLSLLSGGCNLQSASGS